MGFKKTPNQALEPTAPSGRGSSLTSPEEMLPNLTWLVGKRLKEAAKQDYTWSFTFSDGGWIVTESGWRLVATDGIAVTSK